jgi:arylsulfatase
MRKPRNVLLVSYDCVRVDVAYGGGLATLDWLREHGVTFGRAISAAPLTPVSHATIFTGLQPYRHGVRHLLREQLNRRHTTLAAHMQRAGFKTAAIVASPALNRWYGFHRGFHHFDDDLIAPTSTGGPASRCAEDVVTLALGWLSNRSADEPWLLFLHFFDAHWPYTRTSEVSNRREAYEGAIRHLDSCFERVIGWLDEHKALSETLIVVFADHGEDLGGLYPNDKARPEVGLGDELGHGHLLYEPTQHVPLVFAHSSLPVHQTDTLAGLVDVAPTLCSVMGLSPMGDVDGIDLSPMLRGDVNLQSRTLYAETQYPSERAAATGQPPKLPNQQALWLTGGFKVIRAWDDNTSCKAFDLVADPLEVRPFSPSLLPADLLPLAWPPASR